MPTTRAQSFAPFRQNLITSAKVISCSDHKTFLCCLVRAWSVLLYHAGRSQSSASNRQLFRWFIALAAPITDWPTVELRSKFSGPSAHSLYHPNRLIWGLYISIKSRVLSRSHTPSDAGASVTASVWRPVCLETNQPHHCSDNYCSTPCHVVNVSRVFVLDFSKAFDTLRHATLMSQTSCSLLDQRHSHCIFNTEDT